MKTISIQQPINLKVVRFELDFTQLVPKNQKPEKRQVKEIRVPKINCKKKKSTIPPPPSLRNCTNQKGDVKQLVEELLDELYADHRDWTSASAGEFGSLSTASIASLQSNVREQTDAIERNYLEAIDVHKLRQQCAEWEKRLQEAGERLARYVRVRDRLKRQQKRLCSAMTVLLRHITGEAEARFGVTPGEGLGEGGFAEWLHAMRLVARLPAGVPQHFRKKLWLTLAERHLTSRGIDWPAAERACFRGTAHPDDTELGAQILKDLHRTGCSLFCGTEGRENQAMLRRVLLAYARWNKEVGYCQGFNMLAAIILEVMEKSESDSLKVMIYLVEAVLPEGYFADDLRGLSADMAAFRDLLRIRLPRLAHHMDYLQRISDGGGVEPPLPDVFTMQWFLTLYATWLPRESLLRIWDLILLDGNEILLLTALAIWDMLQDRIMSARSADEYYSCMGGGASEVWTAGESLVARVVALGPALELPRLRSLHRYRVTPPAPAHQPPLHTAMQSMTKRGLRLFYSEDEGDSSDDGNKMALATVIPRRENRMDTGDRLSLDIGALKRQYARLRERQRQAHVILAAACARHAAVGVPTSPTSLTVNNLLLGKSAIVSSRGRRLGPPPGAIPPTRQTSLSREKSEPPSHGRSDETLSWKEEKSKKCISRRNSLQWKDIKKEKAVEKRRKASIDLDETGDGVIIPELEANAMIASIRSRSSSETSSYSSHSETSTDTSLCDQKDGGSDSEDDLLEDNMVTKNVNVDHNQITTSHEKDSKIYSPLTEHTLKECTANNTITTPNISAYLDSAAGEPLRTYIDGFETKLIDNFTVCNKEDGSNVVASFKNNIRNPSLNNESKTLALCRSPDKLCLQTLSTHKDIIRPKKLKSVKNVMDLSPIDLSPCHFDSMSPYDYNLKSDYRYSPSMNLNPRPPDIIDSFTIYPNFVPDIDLTDKNVSDFESPPRSTGSDSIVVSEDEPPIPLKIDKYFEHSPEFFGARLTYPNDSNIPNRRATKRQSRIPKKPDSLSIHTDDVKSYQGDGERASSLPHSHSFIKDVCYDSNSIEDDKYTQNSNSKEVCLLQNSNETRIDKTNTSNDKTIESTNNLVFQPGQRNSEKALQIIQENSKILSRILTKQNICNESQSIRKSFDSNIDEIKERRRTNTLEKLKDIRENDFTALKESTSDSLIGYRKRVVNEKNDFTKIRPISLDDPYSLEIRHDLTTNKNILLKNIKSPSSECLGSRIDLCGWENKGFLAKYDFKGTRLDKTQTRSSNKYVTDLLSRFTDSSHEINDKTSKPSISVASMTPDPKETPKYDNSQDNYGYLFSHKYKDLPDIDRFGDTKEHELKIVENILKADNSQASDFTHAVTSSISFTYEPSVEDASPIEGKSNSSDTLCQIASLDQVSTPMSPKMFPNRETPILPIDHNEEGNRYSPKVDSDETCSAITSLIEMDTISSLSYPRSSSTGSYHPFPTRSALRMPKDLPVKLGMYPKDTNLHYSK